MTARSSAWSETIEELGAALIRGEMQKYVDKY